MPIDLVIDERETGPTKGEGLSEPNNNANRSNADSASHTDGASTPEVVSILISEMNHFPKVFGVSLDSKAKANDARSYLAFGARLVTPLA